MSHQVKGRPLMASKRELEFLMVRQEHLEKKQELLIEQMGKRLDFLEQLMLQHAPAAPANANASAALNANDLERVLQHMVERMKPQSTDDAPVPVQAPAAATLIEVECVAKEVQEPPPPLLSPLSFARRRTLI